MQRRLNGDALGDATGLVCLQGAAKALNQPPNLWIGWLYRERHIFRRDRNTYAREDHVAAGRFVHRVRVVDGREYTQVMVSPRGLAYLATRQPHLRGIGALKRLLSHDDRGDPIVAESAVVAHSVQHRV